MIDVCLPDMDGLELTRWLRIQPNTRDVPILMITALDDRRVLARGLDAGATTSSSSRSMRRNCGLRVAACCAKRCWR